MTFFALPFPAIDPILFSVGSLSVRWYGLAYVTGTLLGWWYGMFLLKKYPTEVKPIVFDGFVLWALAGVIIGGRLGNVFFYEPLYYLSNPIEIFKTWHGGMAFHGGVIGVVLAMLVYARRHRIAFSSLADSVAVVVPIGLCLGRVANFINAEIYGKVTDLPWGIVFPNGGPLLRHPTQLYEAALEGLLLLVILYLMWTRTLLRKTPGRLSGFFLFGYGCVRFFIEPFREVISQSMEIIAFGVTMGQILSLPMIVLGLYLMLRKKKGTRNDSYGKFT